MTKAADPFEEYLRKKKVEMLEAKFRTQTNVVDDDEDVDFVPPSNDNPEMEAKIKEEAEDFFTEGPDAGAKIFKKAGTEMGEAKVQEIRDAIEDVFEEEVTAPQSEEDDERFVDFFKQVRDEYDPNGHAGPSEVVPPVQEPEPDQVTETDLQLVEPAAGSESDQPDQPLSDLQLPVEAADLEAAVCEDELVAVEVDEEVAPADSRLSLKDFLGPPADEQELLQRVELLGRLVANLVERARLPESEIIEAMIRSGVEF